MTDYNNILSEYDRLKPGFDLFLESIKTLMSDLIKKTSLNVHIIESRLKSPESLKSKIESKDHKYDSIQEITDICGLRIITFFEKDVDTIGEVIRANFEIDELSSIDKRTLIESDRFGYLSLHIVVKFKSSRFSFPEYSKVNDFKAEIQIRSILQHAWAEIEHDLGYKSKNEVPKHIRRQFARIASLLELADDQFNSINTQLIEYDNEVKDRMNSKEFDQVTIDKISVKRYIRESDLLKRIDEKIAEKTKGDLKFYESALENYSSLGVSLINYLGFKTISEVNKCIDENDGQIVKFSIAWLEDSEHILYRGFSLFHFGYYWAAKKEDENYLKDYIQNLNIGGGASLAAEVQKVYNMVKTE